MSAPQEARPAAVVSLQLSGHYDCLVISDLHLGSQVCQTELLASFLAWAAQHTRVLVLNGDIFDDLNFKRLTSRQVACLQTLRELSCREGFQLVWVHGNHDGPRELVAAVTGVVWCGEYTHINEHLILLVLHGDRFDTFLTAYPWLTEFFCGVFYYLQLWAPHRVSRWVRRITKRWQRNSELIARRAMAYAASRDFRFVTCGHTHLPLVEERQGVRYLNTGTWIEAPPCAFLAVRGSDVTLEFWPRIREVNP